MFKKLFVTLVSFAALVAFSAAQAEVARSIITTGVEQREPVNDLEQVPATNEQVFFFTELRDMTDKSVTHVWKHNGEVIAEVNFNVGGPRWRVWSSKKMLPDWTGEWLIEVVDETGAVLTQKSFSYGAAEAVEEADMDESAAEEAPAEEAMPAGEPESDEDGVDSATPEQESETME